MQREPRYFMVISGGEYAVEAPVDGGHYEPSKGWTNNIGISKGDQMLLYCTVSYPGYRKEAPGIGEVSGVEGSIVSYEYKPIVRPVNLSAIRARFTSPGNKQLENIRFRAKRLFKIEQESFHRVVAGLIS